MQTESNQPQPSDAKAARGGSLERRVRSQKIRESMLERARLARKRLPSSQRAA